MRKILRCLFVVLLCGSMVMLSGCRLNPFGRIHAAIADKIMSDEVPVKSESSETVCEEGEIKPTDNSDKKGNATTQENKSDDGGKGNNGFGGKEEKNNKSESALTASTPIASEKENQETPSDNKTVPNETVTETAKLPDIPLLSNKKLISSSEKPYCYSLGGELVDWLQIGNNIYAVAKDPNVLCVFGIGGIKSITTRSLPAVPYEMRFYDGKLYISYSELGKIISYDLKSLSQLDSIINLGVVTTFCLDGDLLFYGKRNPWCEIYRLNLSTNKSVRIISDGVHNNFADPKIDISRDKNILYIGESNSTGSALYYYNLNDLSQKGVYKRNDYGYANWNRQLRIVGDYIYWAHFKINASKADDIKMQLASDQRCFIHFANAKYVCTTNGIFAATDGASIMDFGAADVNIKCDNAMIAENKTLLVFNENDYKNFQNSVICVPLK